MTIGIFWEFFEYGMDKYFGFDMQKDVYVETLNTVELIPKTSDGIVRIDDINYTILYDSNGKELVKFDNYIDIGIHDTMEDLAVNFVGAFVFSIFGYLYIVNKNRYKLAGVFMTKKRQTKNEG